jgi:hypothetical protein
MLTKIHDSMAGLSVDLQTTDERGSRWAQFADSAGKAPVSRVRPRSGQPPEVKS